MLGRVFGSCFRTLAVILVPDFPSEVKYFLVCLSLLWVSSVWVSLLFVYMLFELLLLSCRCFVVCLFFVCSCFCFFVVCSVSFSWGLCVALLLCCFLFVLATTTLWMA